METSIHIWNNIICIFFIIYSAAISLGAGAYRESPEGWVGRESEGGEYEEKKFFGG